MCSDWKSRQNYWKKGVKKIVEISCNQNDNLFNNHAESYYMHNTYYRAYTSPTTSSNVFNGRHNDDMSVKNNTMKSRLIGSPYDCRTSCLICGDKLDFIQANKY